MSSDDTLRELHHFEVELENERLTAELEALRGPGVEVFHVRLDGGVRYWRKGVNDPWHRSPPETGSSPRQSEPVL